MLAVDGVTVKLITVTAALAVPDAFATLAAILCVPGSAGAV